MRRECGNARRLRKACSAGGSTEGTSPVALVGCGRAVDRRDQLGWIKATEMQRVEKWRQVITALKQESSEANKD